MRFDPNNVPLFDGEDDARATQVQHACDPMGVAYVAATAVLAKCQEGWSGESLSAKPVLSSGQADNLHHVGDGERLWLSRTGVSDGEPFENTITIEREVDGRWVSIAKYDGGEVFGGECRDCGTGGLDSDLQREGEDFLLCDSCRDKREAAGPGRFVLEVEPGNEAMQTTRDVVEVLHQAAEAIHRVEHMAWEGEGKIRDRNGNTVGRYTFHDHN